MKLTVYSIREDEVELFHSMAAERGIELVATPEPLGEDTYELARGAEAAAIVGSCRIDENSARSLAALGVKYVLTRGTGYDHIDPAAAKKYGLRCANVRVYSHSAVSEYAVMTVLALLRGLKGELGRVSAHDFRLPAVPARELGSLTAGVYGTGLIGSQTARLLRAFGCRVLAYTPHPRAELADVVEYVTQQELFRRSDVIILHCALTEATRNLINPETLAVMKRGVCLVNAARGPLIDYAAVLEALKSGQVAALATDVYPGESAYVHHDMAGQPLDPTLAELISMDNVIVTPHIAFFTDTAVANIIKAVFDNLRDLSETGECKNELFAGE